MTRTKTEPAPTRALAGIAGCQRPADNAGTMRRLLALAAMATSACGPAASSTVSPSAASSAAAAAYASLARTYNAAEAGIQTRAATGCSLDAGSFSACHQAMADDLAATQAFNTGLAAVAMPAEAQKAAKQMVADQTTLITALTHAVAAGTLQDIDRVSGAEILPANLTVHHDSIVLRTALGLPIPTPAPATPSPS
jgi:hypothetical protein